MAKRHRGGCSHGVQSGVAPVLLLGCCWEAERQAAGGGQATPWALVPGPRYHPGKLENHPYVTNITLVS